MNFFLNLSSSGMKTLQFNDLKDLSCLFYARQLVLEHQTTKKLVVLSPTTHEEIIISSHAAPCLQIQCLIECPVGKIKELSKDIRDEIVQGWGELQEHQQEAW